MSIAATRPVYCMMTPNRRRSCLALGQPRPMEDSDVDEREGLLMGEVARRLEPRLPEILRAWTAAIPLVAPPDKIPGMRRTLVALTKEFVDSFFPALIAGGPQLALTAYIEFAERLMRRRPPATASN